MHLTLSRKSDEQLQTSENRAAVVLIFIVYPTLFQLTVCVPVVVIQDQGAIKLSLILIKFYNIPLDDSVSH